MSHHWRSALWPQHATSDLHRPGPAPVRRGLGRSRHNLSIGNNVDFYPSTVTVGSSSNNASSDSTATAFGGSDHVTGAVTENQFISIVAGAEDLHLSGSSDAIKAGVVLTEPEGVEYDIDGQIRAGLWDIGADQTVSGHIRRTLLGIG